MLIRVMAVVIILSFACQHDVAKKTTPIIHIKKEGGGAKWDVYDALDPHQLRLTLYSDSF